MLRLFNKNKRERVLIKTKIPYLRNLIGNGIEFTYKPGCVGSGEGWKYWRNFGNWTKNVHDYKYAILGENDYNFDVSRYIKQKNPNCKVIVFYWNKIVFDSYLEILKDPNVDAFYTFDEDEAKKYNFKLNSTFYTKGLTLPENKIEKDVLFLGRSKDRKKDIKDIEKILKKNHLKTDFRIIEDEKDYVDYYDYLELLSKSKAILDYNAYDQRGLSLRVMESLFHEKKLITSNKEIKKYNFYNKNNIFIIGEDKWENINNFINSEYEKVPEEIIDYYDFENWINRFDTIPKDSVEIENYRKLGVKIGSNFTNIGPVDFSSEPYLISIGDDVRISMNVHFVTHDGGMHVLRQYKNIPADSFGTIEVGNNVFIGMNSIILPGVKIGNNVIIGAGSIVTKSIPDNSIACGIPAKVIETIDEYYEKNKDKIDMTKNLSPEEKREYLMKKYRL